MANNQPRVVPSRWQMTAGGLDTLAHFVRGLLDQRLGCVGCSLVDRVAATYPLVE